MMAPESQAAGEGRRGGRRGAGGRRREAEGCDECPETLECRRTEGRPLSYDTGIVTRSVICAKQGFICCLPVCHKPISAALPFEACARRSLSAVSAAHLRTPHLLLY